MLLRSILIPLWILQQLLLIAVVVTTIIIATTIRKTPNVESPSLAYAISPFL